MNLENCEWSHLKNERVKKTRGASFDEILKTKLVYVGKHPAKELQEVMLFEREGYIWVVPFVRMGDKVFLKTLYQSRKYTKLFKKGEIG